MPDEVVVDEDVADADARSEAFQLIWIMGAHALMLSTVEVDSEVVEETVSFSTVDLGSVISPATRSVEEHIPVVITVEVASI